ncbi:MAG: trigger factor [bacterium]
MKVTVEKPSPVKRLLRIEENSKIIDKEEKKLLRHIASNRRFPGFRPGKIPLPLLKKMLGDEVSKSSLNSVIEKLSQQAIEQEKLNPVSEIEEKDIKIEDEALSFTISFEVIPEFEIKSLEDLEVEKPHYEINDEVIENKMKMFQERAAYLEKVERPCQKGDYLIFDMTCQDDQGNKPEELNFQNRSVEITENNFWENFIDHIIGISPEEHREFSFEIPPANEKYGGKSYNFNITANQVKKKVLPELNDDFAKDYGFEDLEKMKEYLTQNTEQELNEKEQRDFEENILKALEDQYPLEIPSTMVEKELEQLMKAFKSHFNVNKDIKTLKTDLEELASRKVKQYIILDKFAQHHKIELSNEEINKNLIDAIGQKVGYHKIDKPTIKKMTKDWEFVRDVFWDTKRRKTLEKIKQLIKVREVNGNAQDR